MGMYVSELDRPWLGTPFLFQGFEIQTDEELEQLRALCRYVYVLSGDSLVAHTLRRTKPLTAMPQAARSATIRKPVEYAVTETSSRDIPRSGSPPSRYADQTPVEEELQQAVEFERSARETIYSILDDARLGRSVDTPRAKIVVGQMTESVIRNPDALVWLTHLKKKHEYTALHSLRVCVLALALGRHLGYGPEKLNILGLGALLHDIGKLHVPIEILDKPEALTREEFEIMKLHVPNGLKILENAEGIPPAALEVVGRHHERYNGNGYAFGLSGDDIGEFGLISAIAAGGPAVFYAGWVADSIVAEMERGGGLITHEDLAAYRPFWRDPITFTYRGHTIHSMAPSSSGGITLALMLNMLEGTDSLPPFG